MIVASHYHGVKGLWAYRLFEELNRVFFAGQLPWPHINWALTPYGACLGYSHTLGPPVIVLHPSLLRGSEKHNPWKVPSAWLGWRFAADVLLHEMIHLSVLYGKGADNRDQSSQGTKSGTKPSTDSGTTSHNNPSWVAEVNRLLGLLNIPGSENCQAGMTRIKRVPSDGPATIRGKRPTRVERVTEGNLPFSVVAGFPGALRQHVHQANRYYQGLCPACSPAFEAPAEIPEEPPVDGPPRNR